ncbi:MAG TPA: PP2C family protein-serine/threonine phosphatase [Bacillales bacterium]
MFQDKLSVPHVSGKAMDQTLQREIKLARNIQSTLLNGQAPDFQGGKVSGTSMPARLIGGDYYDFYPLVNGKIRIVIGDVMGKGIPAAMLMILTRGAFRSAAQSTQNPGETLAAMNRALYKDLRALGSFVTLFCADWDPETFQLTYANAGHNPPLYLNGQKGVIETVPKVSGVMVGGLPDQSYEERAIVLEKNDMVFFYTDGIVEAQNDKGEQYQLERLMSTLTEYGEKGAEEIEREVMGSIRAFTEEVPQKDDITMVLLKINADQSDITSLNSPLL